MARSPIPLREVRAYLQLEDVEELTSGSVKYVGATGEGVAATHWWSYPTQGAIGWVRLEGDCLGIVDEAPHLIRAQSEPVSAHPTKRLPKPPPNAWVGSDIQAGDLPRWVPQRRVTQFDGAYVAAFLDDFDRVAAVFKATPSTDTHGGGAGPCRFFFLELTRNRLAMLECSAGSQHIGLHLPCSRDGAAAWDDYFQVMDPIGLRLEQVFRQGGITWKHRKPTPASIERTRDHQRRMWLPPNAPLRRG